MKDLEHYINRFPIWFREDETSMIVVSLITDLHFDYINTVQEILDKIDIDKAANVQLDLIGKIINVNRNFPISDLIGYDGKLDDLHFRRLIKGKIASINLDGSRNKLEEALKTSYGADISFTIEDYQNMKYKVYITGIENVSEVEGVYTPNPIDVALITSGKYIPKPMGIGVEYEVIDNPLFRYDVLNNIFFAGWDVGSWEE